MKSKRAEEFVNGCMEHLGAGLSRHAEQQLRAALTHVGGIAEADARERAVRAMCATCNSHEARKRLGCDNENHPLCGYITEEFLKCYDNE